MLTPTPTTPYRPRRRRRARIPVTVTRDRRSIRLVPVPTPGVPDTFDAPDAPWPRADHLVADLDQATWEDAEWR